MSDMPPPQMPEPEEPAEKPFWKRWWFIAGAIFVVLMAIGAGAEEVEEEPVAAESTVEEEPSEAKPTEDPTPAPTEMAEEVAAEVTEEPEEIVAEETEYELTEEDMRTAVFPIVFESTRDGVIGVLDDMYVIESVDQYVYDGESGTVLVSLTPAFDFDEGVRDDAWEVMRAFGVLYDEDAWLDPSGKFIPTLEVDISTAHYRCDGETMVAINESRLSRSDWESACRVG